MKKGLIRFVILAALGFAIGGAFAYFDLQRDVPAKPAPKTISMASPLKGDFTLISETGETVTPEKWQGLPKLVFFGFTHCPDICPTTLEKISIILDEMGEEAANIVPLFITVDPARDTPEIMAEYTDMFDPRIIGLTGSQAQIDDAAKQYKIYVAKDALEATETAHGGHNAHGAHGDHNYMMQHSAYIYIMGPENELLDVVPSKDSVADIIAVFQESL